MSVNEETPAPAESAEVPITANDDSSAEISFSVEPGQAFAAMSATDLSIPEDARRAELMAAASAYARKGWKVIPVWWINDEDHCACRLGPQCPNPGKHPVQSDWPNQPRVNEDEVTYWWRPDDQVKMPVDEWYPRANIGIVTGSQSGIFVLDEDQYNGGDTTLAAYEHRHSELPATRIHETGSGGRHYLFRQPDFVVRNSAGKRMGKGLDIRGEHGFIVAPPSVSQKGPYALTHDLDVAAAPDWMLALLRTEDRGQRGQIIAGREPTAGTGVARRYTEAALASETKRMRNAASGTRNDTLNEVSFSLGTLGGAGLLTEDAAWKAIHEAALSTGLGEDEVKRTFLNGWRAGLSEPRQVQWSVAGGDWPMRARSDFGLGERMADHFADVLRWCPEHKRWYVFVAGVWGGDTTETGEWYAQAMIRRLPDTEGAMYDDTQGEDSAGNAEPSPQDDFVAWCEKQHTVKAVSTAARLSRGLPLMRISAGHFDPDPLLLNTLNGVAELRSGQRLEHDPELRMTLQATASYHPGATAPEWDRFLETVQPDPEVRSYLQRVIGYSATASTDEQVMFLHHGSGANGKSVFQRIVNALLGGYAQVVPMETLMATQVEGQVPNDVARMAGKRLLSAAETKMGKTLDEAKIKSLTGGEVISARFMRGEFFEFRPVGKIHLTTNHLPRMSDDPATWRRLRLITWPVVIAPEDRDPELADRILKNEAEGVLAWIIEGARMWMAEGLNPPQTLLDATEDYQHEEDSVIGFLEECVDTGLDHSTRRLGSSAKDFWVHYNQWATDNGHPKMSQKALTARLKKKIDYHRSNGQALFTNAVIKGVTQSS